MWYLFELKKITIRNRVEMKYMVWNEVPVPASTGQYTDHHLRISIINEPRYTNRLLLMRFYYRPNILRNFIKILTLEHDSETYRKRYLKKSFAGRIVLIISFFFFVFFFSFVLQLRHLDRFFGQLYSQHHCFRTDTRLHRSRQETSGCKRYISLSLQFSMKRRYVLCCCRIRN